MKRLLITGVLALGFLVSAQDKVKADCGFGIGIGLNFSFSSWKRKCPPAPCAYPSPYACSPYPGCPYPCPPYCGYPMCPFPGFAPGGPGFGGPGFGGPGFGGAHPGMMGMHGPAMAGMMPYYGGMPAMSIEQSAMAIAGVPGYAGYPTLFAGNAPMGSDAMAANINPGFTGMDPMAMAMAYGINPYSMAMPTWGGYPTMPEMPSMAPNMAMTGFNGQGMAFGTPIPVSVEPFEEKKLATTERGYRKPESDPLANTEE